MGRRLQRRPHPPAGAPAPDLTPLPSSARRPGTARQPARERLSRRPRLATGASFGCRHAHPAALRPLPASTVAPARDETTASRETAPSTLPIGGFGLSKLLRDIRESAVAALSCEASQSVVHPGGATGIVCTVTDVHGEPVAGVEVIPEVIAGHGWFTGIGEALTDERGQAVITFLAPPAREGLNNSPERVSGCDHGASGERGAPCSSVRSAASSTSTRR